MGGPFAVLVSEQLLAAGAKVVVGLSSAGAVAVEMQAASLFAFAQTRRAVIGVVAMISNSGDHTGEQFDTGEHAYRVAVLDGIIAGAARFIRARRSRTSRRTGTTTKR
jgi:hypothetical protein